MGTFSRLPENRTPAAALFQEAKKEHGISGIAIKLGLHDNTVKRWIINGKVPSDYYLDFARMLGKPVDATQVEGIDQFYTRPEVAGQCWTTFKEVAENLGVNLKGYTFIEPSAGCGWFYNLMPANRRIGIDISPRPIDVHGMELIRDDFLCWTPPSNGKFVVVGNPPFGLRGHLALQFVNHAAKFADLVGFILPQLFESDGKGVPAKRVKDLRLAYSKALPPDSFQYPDGQPTSISTVFQVWTRINFNRIRLRSPPTCNDFIRVYSLSDGGVPANTRNKAMLYKCDVYLPSTCYDGMHAYSDFEDLPHRRGYGIVIHRNKRKIKSLLMKHDWTKTAFPSTNSAVNLRSSLIAAVVTQAGFKDK